MENCWKSSFGNLVEIELPGLYFIENRDNASMPPNNKRRYWEELVAQISNTYTSEKSV